MKNYLPIRLSVFFLIPMIIVSLILIEGCTVSTPEFSGESAFQKIAAGASAVQLYTGLIYKGPTIIKEIKKELIVILKNKGFKNIKEAIGSDSN